MNIEHGFSILVNDYSFQREENVQRDKESREEKVGRNIDGLDTYLRQ
jgi:hypothetical protein